MFVMDKQYYAEREMILEVCSGIAFFLVVNCFELLHLGASA